VARIFISYRRDDTAGFAGRLYADLSARVGASSLFRDIDTIQPGAAFPTAIQQAIGSCHVFLALIGPHWATAAERGQRRLDNPSDYVRQEVEAALRQPNILVIPVLVQGTVMPRKQDLPVSLTPLTDMHALTLGDAHWRVDVDRLLEAMRKSTLVPEAEKPMELGLIARTTGIIGVAATAVGTAADLPVVKEGGVGLVLGSGLLFVAKYVMDMRNRKNEQNQRSTAR
jgi:hypothetical protein